MKLFSKSPVAKTVEYQVVEVEKPRPLLDADYKNSVPSLAGHPGFIYLLNKLKLERAKLKKYFEENRHADLRSVDFIQSGLFWTNWLETQLAASKAVPTAANLLESEAFSEAQSTLDLVGSEDPHKG